MSRIVRKPGFFAYAKTKAQISFGVTAKLISAFVFATWIVQFVFFLNPKFQVLACFCDHAGLCQTWSETPKTGFLVSRLILCKVQFACAKNTRV